MATDHAFQRIIRQWFLDEEPTQFSEPVRIPDMRDSEPVERRIGAILAGIGGIDRHAVEYPGRSGDVT